MKTRIGLFVVIGIGFFIFGCSFDKTGLSPYELAIDKSLNYSGKPSVTLLAGLEFGMSQSSFFEFCKKQQTLGKMSDGLGNMVRVKLDSSLFHSPGVVEFYPEFSKEGSIVALRGRAYSLAWAPWNTQLNADSIGSEFSEFLVEELGGADFELLEGMNPKVKFKWDNDRRTVVFPHEHSMERLVFRIDQLSQADSLILSGKDVSAGGKTMSDWVPQSSYAK